MSVLLAGADARLHRYLPHLKDDERAERSDPRDSEYTKDQRWASLRLPKSEKHQQRVANQRRLKQPYSPRCFMKPDLKAH